MTRALPALDFAARLTNLRKFGSIKQGDALFVSSMANIRYLAGFSGSAGILLVFADAALLFVDSRYTESVTADALPTVEIVPVNPGQHEKAITREIRGLDRLLFDPSQITVDTYGRLEDVLAADSLVQARNLPEKLRLIKDAGEIARLREAARIACEAFETIRSTIQDEPTERTFAATLENRMKQLGADSIGFATIVASGPNSSQPHAQLTDRVIREGDPVVVDFGATVDGYHSDVTRTVWFGEVSDDLRSLYAAALAAHDDGVAAVVVGATHASVDARCRETYSAHGYSDKPLHPSGHNVGLAIHERPFLSPYASDVIGNSYVITVEPGMYVPNLGGCRIEDMVLAGPDGPEILSTLSNAKVIS